MMKLTFSQFEKAANILENSPMNVSDAVLLENGITREELERVNEGLIGDIFGGIFKGFKEKLLKMVPGSVLRKADAILKEYKEAKMGISDKTLKERNKMYKASVEMEENPSDTVAKRRYDEIKIRSEKAVEQIEAANKSKIDAIEKKLRLLIRDKGDTVKDYVDYELAQIQEDVANKQLKDAEENASEEILTKLENEVKEAKKKKEAAAAELKKLKDDEDSQKEKERNNSEKAKKGQQWKRVSSKGEEQEVYLDGEIDKEKKQVHVKLVKDGKPQGAGFISNLKDLTKLIKDAGESTNNKETELKL